MELNRGTSVRPGQTVLASRAAGLLAAGPADDVTLVAHVCNLPSPPLRVAERLAAAIFAGRPEFVRDADGRWTLGKAATAGSAECDGGVAVVSDLLASLSFAVVDVETTGSMAMAGDRITEVAVTVVRDGCVTDSFETLVNPERPIPAYITRLTNITSAMVQHAPTFREVAPRVVEAISGHVFTAHNATFDWRFISAELSRADGVELAGRRLCTVKLARKLLPQLQRRSLDYLALHYGVEIANRHRAGGDALATARCLVRLLEEARDRGCETWDDLERFGRRARRRRPRRARGSPTPVTRDTTA
ncbi:MAG TPA: 3'-5' exonuclease [Gemmatimonadaceae bacterium]|nr:3'-5' exonuclease [Gemmatimonadaceae bacterium]